MVKNILTTPRKIKIAKVLYFFTNIFFGRKKERIITRNGVKYDIDLSESLYLSLFLFGNYQGHITRNKVISIPKDGVVIDVGANFGLMCLKFAQMVPQGMVYAFEPTHYALGKLKRNLALNPELAAHVEVINSFVSSKSSENANIKAYSSWRLNTEEDGKHPVHSGIAMPTEGVGAVSLNDFCKQKNLTRVDFIKIDTDGHEHEVFGGAAEMIAKYRPQIIFEIGLYVMKDKGISFNFYSDYFSKLNYKLYDSGSGALITIDNYEKYIPEQGTIDIVANPQK